jgi:hypothetical protein
MSIRNALVIAALPLVASLAIAQKGTRIYIQGKPYVQLWSKDDGRKSLGSQIDHFPTPKLMHPFLEIHPVRPGNPNRLPRPALIWPFLKHPQDNPKGWLLTPHGQTAYRNNASLRTATGSKH